MKGEQIEGLGAFHPSVLLHLIDGLIMSFFRNVKKNLHIDHVIHLLHNQKLEQN